jgi:hypothetical protein
VEKMDNRESLLTLIFKRMRPSLAAAGCWDSALTKLYEAQERGREARRLQSSLSPQRGPQVAARCLLPKKRANASTEKD